MPIIAPTPGLFGVLALRPTLGTPVRLAIRADQTLPGRRFDRRTERQNLVFDGPSLTGDGGDASARLLDRLNAKFFFRLHRG